MLDGIVRALQLDEAERAHLFDLARAAAAGGRSRSSRRTSQERVRPSVLRILDALSSPAFVANARGDLLASNVLGEAFYAPLYAGPERPVNTARFIFLNRRASEFFVDWDTVADDAIGIPARRRRARSPRPPAHRSHRRARHPQRRVPGPVAAHKVKLHRTGTKRFHHPIVGDVTVDFPESLDLPGDLGQKVIVYTAELDRRPSAQSTYSPAGRLPLRRQRPTSPWTDADPGQESLYGRTRNCYVLDVWHDSNHDRDSASLSTAAWRAGHERSSFLLPGALGWPEMSSGDDTWTGFLRGVLLSLAPLSDVTAEAAPGSPEPTTWSGSHACVHRQYPGGGRQPLRGGRGGGVDTGRRCH